MYACMYVLYAYIAYVCACIYVYLHVCIYVCMCAYMYLYMQFSSWVLSGTGGIVLVGRGNCPGELSGELSGRGNVRSSSAFSQLALSKAAFHSSSYSNLVSTTAAPQDHHYQQVPPSRCCIFEFKFEFKFI